MVVGIYNVVVFMNECPAPVVLGLIPVNDKRAPVE